jgi:protocatechuate 3,4-dioxygenase beta subunit
MRYITIILFAVSAIFYGAGLSTAAESNRCQPTMNDVEGPYYLPGAPFRNELAGPDEQGERLIIKGTVLRTNCRTPVRGALIEVWQTDEGGNYYYRAEDFRLRGQMKSDDNGSYQFSTIRPGRYRIMNGFRPAHIHLKISHPDFETITTQLYFRGDPYLWPNDACGRGCKSNDPQRIIALNEARGVLRGTFNIILKPLSKP